jgi:DNA-directed RNA polymerase subunit RPC12/RpoP
MLKRIELLFLFIVVNQFFLIHTLTPWDGQNTSQLTQVKLLSLKSVFDSFPVVEKRFFKDLAINTANNAHYSWMLSIKRIVGPNNEDYDITKFNLVWAMDDQRRMYQFLFQKVGETREASQGVLVALAPPELAKLLMEYERSAIVRILSLLNDSNKIRLLMILGSKGKSIAEESQLFHFNKKDAEKLKYVNTLQNMPNIQGQWFPSITYRCPICNNEVSMVENYAVVGVSNLVCPQCGHKKMYKL